MDCIISAEFTSPHNQKIIREAYWDGENIYRVSFAPTEIGIWKYSFLCEGEPEIDRKTGEIECWAECWEWSKMKLKKNKTLVNYSY